MQRQCLRRLTIVRSDDSMDDGGLNAALDRAHHALDRIEQAFAAREQQSRGQDDQLRSKVREAVAELDQLIRESADG